jgi:hypothetical protein
MECAISGEPGCVVRLAMMRGQELQNITRNGEFCGSETLP